MKDPSRWVELSSDEFERELLQSSRGDIPTEHAYQRTLTRLGVGFLMPMAAAQVAEGAAQAVALTAAAPAKALGAYVLAKWLGSGMLLGVVTASGIGLSSRVWPQKPPEKAPISSGSERALPPAVVAKNPVPTLATSSAPEPVLAASAVGRRNVRSAEPRSAAPIFLAPALPLPEPKANAPALTDASSLEREMRLLDAARRALARQAAAEALTTLRSYTNEFEHGSLAPEARVLEVRALLEAGERERASALGARIIAADPRGRHAEAVRALLGRASNP